MKLVFNDAEFADQWCVLGNGLTSVGRGSANRLIIQHNSVSIHHCEMLVHGSEVIVRDLDSANGTWVDGIRVNGQHEVRNGQSIRFGSVAARLVGPERPVEEPSEVTAVHLHVAAIKQSQQPAAPVAPARTVIRPLTKDDDAGGTTTVLSNSRHERLAGMEPAAELAPAGKSRTMLFVLLALVAVTLTYVLWRVR